MSYSTQFLGSFQFSRPLLDHEVKFLNQFAAVEHYQYDVEKLQEEFGGRHGNPAAVEEPYGPEGGYFTKELPADHPAVLDPEVPPVGQPVHRCHWEATSRTLRHNGELHFRDYVEWLDYLIDHFFGPWGVRLNGAVQWQGEAADDCGVISLRNNRINIHYEDAEEED